LLSYSVFLFLWIPAKPYYGLVLTHVAAPFGARTAGVKVEKIVQGKDVTTITFARSVWTREGLGDMLMDMRIKVSHYSFNVPLTFALVFGLYPLFRWRKRTVLEAAAILILVHLAYLYFLCALRMFHQLYQGGFPPPSRPVQFFFQFMWTFTDTMVIRFEPFLVAVYLWFRNARGRLSLS